MPYVCSYIYIFINTRICHVLARATANQRIMCDSPQIGNIFGCPITWKSPAYWMNNSPLFKHNLALTTPLGLIILVFFSWSRACRIGCNHGVHALNDHHSNANSRKSGDNHKHMWKHFLRFSSGNKRRRTRGSAALRSAFW